MRIIYVFSLLLHRFDQPSATDNDCRKFTLWPYHQLNVGDAFRGGRVIIDMSLSFTST